MRANLLIRGHTCLWSIDTEIPDADYERMREDGVALSRVVYEEEWEGDDDEKA